jgi:hypothetical protein
VYLLLFCQTPQHAVLIPEGQVEVHFPWQLCIPKGFLMPPIPMHNKTIRSIRVYIVEYSITCAKI